MSKTAACPSPHHLPRNLVERSVRGGQHPNRKLKRQKSTRSPSPSWWVGGRGRPPERVLALAPQQESITSSIVSGIPHADKAVGQPGTLYSVHQLSHSDPQPPMLPPLAACAPGIYRGLGVVCWRDGGEGLSTSREQVAGKVSWLAAKWRMAPSSFVYKLAYMLVSSCMYIYTALTYKLGA